MYGVDVSKETLDICLYVNKVQGKIQFLNRKEGFRDFLQWAKSQPDGTDSACCFEATGRYHEEFADFLVEHGFKAYPVSGYSISCYRKALLQRSKTDAGDAEIIAQFGEAHQNSLYCYQPISRARKTLKTLARTRSTFTQQQTRIKNQIGSLTGSSTDSSTRKLLRKSLRSIGRQIDSLDKEMRKVIQGDLELCIMDDVIRSIPGISYISSSRILAELPMNSKSVRAWDQYAGLVGCANESGTSVHHRPRCSVVSNARLRTALYMPAVAVSKMDNPLGAFYRRLHEDARKEKMVAINALMRKLLHIVFGVLKHLEPYNPDLVGPLASKNERVS